MKFVYLLTLKFSIVIVFGFSVGPHHAGMVVHPMGSQGHDFAANIFQ